MAKFQVGDKVRVTEIHEEDIETYESLVNYLGKEGVVSKVGIEYISVRFGNDDTRSLKEEELTLLPKPEPKYTKGFDVGDTVRVVDDSHRHLLEIGHVGKITRVYPYSSRLFTIDDFVSYVHEDDLELVEKAPEKDSPEEVFRTFEEELAEAVITLEGLRNYIKELTLKEDE